MNVAPLDLPIHREENAVSALLRLRAEVDRLTYYRSMEVYTSVYTPWFFMLKLIHELERIDKPAAGAALLYAKEAKKKLGLVRSSAVAYNDSIHNWLEQLAGCIDCIEDAMKEFILRYPGEVKPLPSVQAVLMSYDAPL